MGHHKLAEELFEQRMGFAFTDEYEQSREWSAALEESATLTEGEGER